MRHLRLTDRQMNSIDYLYVSFMVFFSSEYIYFVFYDLFEKFQYHATEYANIQRQCYKIYGNLNL